MDGLLNQLISVGLISTAITIVLVFISYLILCLINRTTSLNIEVPHRKWLIMSLFIIYCLSVLSLTLFLREDTMGRVDFHLFSSYLRSWHQITSGGWHMLVYNILMFIPLGLFLPLLIKRCKKLHWAGMISLLASFLIELIQLITNTGIFEIDDILNNCIGGMIGWGIMMSWITCWNKSKYYMSKACMYLIPLVLSISVAMSTTILYVIQDYGNFSTAPNYSWNMKYAEIVLQEELDKDELIKPTYKLVNKSHDEMIDYKDMLIKKYYLNEFEISKSDSSSIKFTYQDQVLIIKNNGGFSIFLEEANEFTLNEEDFIQSMEELDLDYLLDNKISIEQNVVTIDLSFMILDETAYSGELILTFSEQLEITQVEGLVNQSKFIRNEEICSAYEAWQSVEQGWFKAYQVDSIEEIKLTNSRLVYQRDSKNFYQPVYQFNVILNNQVYTELLVPAIK